MAVGYNQRLSDLSATVEGLEWLPSALNTKFADRGRAYYSSGARTSFSTNQGSRIYSPESVVERALYDAGAQDRVARAAVCVIEDINPRWIQVIGEAWQIPLDFFLNHAKNPSRNNIWNNIFDRDRDPMQAVTTTNSDRAHIDGVFGYPDWKMREGRNLDSGTNFMRRHCWDGPDPYPVSSNTRISYYRVSPVLYLFLVDANIDLTLSCIPKRPRSRPTLRLPCSSSRGGLMLPSLYDNLTNSIFESLATFFDHAWHFSILYSPDLSSAEVIPPPAFLYLLSASLWSTNLRILDSEIKRISFNELRQPTSVQINSQLHDCREDLALLKEYVTESRKYLPKTVDQWHINAFSKMSYHKTRPLEALEGILEDADKLSQLLMDSFQLLMSTVSTLDSQTSLEQARRAARLTQLAFIYVPLSFVTSIFGMNLKEINGSSLSVWVAFVALVIVVVGTAVIFWSFESFKTYTEQTKLGKSRSAGNTKRDTSSSLSEKER